MTEPTSSVTSARAWRGHGVLLARLDAAIAFRAQGAIQAAFGFGERLLLGEADFNLVEIVQPRWPGQFRRMGP